MVMLMQSHVEVNVRFGEDVPGGKLVDCDGEVKIRFWWVECLGDCC